MLFRSVYFRGGVASYRNRFVHTDALLKERQAGYSRSPGVMGPFDYSVSPFGIKDTSNTDVFIYHGDVISLWYNAGNPCHLDGRSLENRGAFALDGRPWRRMSAHSKVDWATGELLFFDYGDEPPYMTYEIGRAHV